MRIQFPLWRAVLIGGASLSIVAGCVVGGPGYDGYGGDVGYVGGYYEPSGYDYGGWGGRYRVGPPRGVGHDGGHDSRAGHPTGGGHPMGGGRSAPSIPGRPRR
jgi:hypothetical protein